MFATSLSVVTLPGEHPRDHNNVTVGVDGSPASGRAVAWAAATAAARGAALHLVHAVDFVSTGWAATPFVQTSQVFEWAEEDARAVLKDAERIARDTAPDLEITAALSLTGSAKWLVELSRQTLMLVLGASGSGRIGEVLLGSTPVAVVGHAECPVVVVRGDREIDADGPVVVGVDGSPLSEDALAAAFEEASFRNVDLVAVHVWSDVRSGAVDRSPLVFDPRAFEESEHALLAERLAGYRERYPDVAVDRKVYIDGPRTHLLEWSEKAQLVVVGSRGRGGFTGLILGSTSQALLRAARCPVMVVRPDET
ncbi:MAG: universal stress protein [Rhodococcus sp.]|uniref:universal stress protein n=1 Tax=Rhodococcus sp. TaxID=1831 RepID=UPI0016A40504|nr:universal stress protein [Rhodococcus sp. (in: high G+C Gram-positive bacteria)]NLV77787.1 universal stress protein [Rhodococcus sp. (in: high G+C Gram-positive bacteria)]